MINLNIPISPTPVFVVGSPRSGTTMIGAYISSAPSITDLGEYAGFDFTHRLAVQELSGMPSAHVERYLCELKDHARKFANNISIEEKTKYFCDSAPWNLLSASSICVREADSIFILCVRDVRGVIQSLEKSYEQGYEWCGRNFEARLQVWIDFYSQASYIPIDRLIVFDYDDFCENPEVEIAKLDRYLKNMGFVDDVFDHKVFAKSHAKKNGDSGAVAANISDIGNVVFKGRLNWNRRVWSSQNEACLQQNSRYQQVLKCISKLKENREIRSCLPRVTP